MPRLGYFLVNGLITATVGIGPIAIIDRYVNNIPESVVALAQAEDEVPAWKNPETTGTVAPKAERASADTAVSQGAADPGSTLWIAPPRRSKASDRSVSVNGETMELRLPRQ